MIHLRRSHSLLGTDATRTNVSLHAPNLRVYCVAMAGGQRHDTGVLGITAEEGNLGGGAVSVQLGGELGIRVNGSEHGVRSSELCAYRLHGWDERWEGPFRALVIEWTDPGDMRFPALEVGPASPADRAAFADFADRLDRGELRGEPAARAVIDLLSRLRATGMPTPRRTVGDLHAATPAGAQEIADAIGATISRLDAGPQLEDVAAALGVSTRQVSRRLSATGAWLPAFSRPGGWRRKLRQYRATCAASFLTRSDASLDQVARSLGYGSARALLLALEQEGLPPPRVLRTV